MVQFNKDYDFLFKVLIIGESGVGKSSLLSRYADKTYNEIHTSTIGVDFKQKMIEFNEEKIRLQIWDTAGNERFHTITGTYYRGAHGILVVYDVSNRKSFERLGHFFDEIKDKTKNPITLLVGTKTDRSDVEVSEEEARALAVNHNSQLVLTSSKEDAESVDNAFMTIVKQIRAQAKNDLPKGGFGSHSSTFTRPDVISAKNSDESSSFLCCL